MLQPRLGTGGSWAFGEGIADLDAALEVDPDEAEVGYIFEVAELREILNATGSEILLDPGGMEAYINRGHVLVGLQHYEESIISGL